MKPRHFLYWVCRYWLQLLCEAFFRSFQHTRLLTTSKNKVFLLDSVFCQLGNNIQQMLVAEIHAYRYDGKICMSARFYEHARKIGIDPERLPNYVSLQHLPASSLVVRGTFFHFSNHSFLGDPRYTAWRIGSSPRRCSLISEKQIVLAASSTALKCRRAFQRLLQLPPSNSEVLGQNPRCARLVLHLRSGDVSDLCKPEYATNPLCYYECLARSFRDIIVVTQPGPEHVLFRDILGLFDNVRVVSGEYRDDFSLLANAQCLATSGVSTFPIAAALLSSRLEHFFSSDAYLMEHLNPLWLSARVHARIFRMPDYLRLWRKSRDRQQLLRDYRPDVCEFSVL